MPNDSREFWGVHAYCIVHAVFVSLDNGGDFT